MVIIGNIIYMDYIVINKDNIYGYIITFKYFLN